MFSVALSVHCWTAALPTNVFLFPDVGLEASKHNRNGVISVISTQHTNELCDTKYPYRRLERG